MIAILPCIISTWILFIILQIFEKCCHSCVTASNCCSTPLFEQTVMDPDKPFELIPWPLEDSKKELKEEVEMIVVKHQQEEAQLKTVIINHHQNSDLCEGSKILPLCQELMESNKHLWRVSTYQDGHICIDGILVSKD